MFDQVTLSNGLRIIGERIPHFRSVSLGLWVRSGSLYETNEENGVSHFIEHMLFKGTSSRTARQIAEEMDAVGGSMNAFTSRECTCFYAKVVDEHLPLAMDVIADIAQHSLFTQADIDREKGVVLEEIGMTEDQPDDLVSELILEARLGRQAASRPILGTADSLGAMNREMITDYYHRMYRPENCVLSVAGNYDTDTLVKLAENLYGDWKATGAEIPSCTVTQGKAGIIRKKKDIEQLHICLAWPGIPENTKKIYPLSILNNVFGGAVSSRLFQRIREESGLAYNVYSYPVGCPGLGLLCVYAGASRENAPEVLNMIREEARSLRDNGITEKEFLPSREQLKSSYILGQESTSSRMSAIGRRMLIYGTTVTESDIIQNLNNTSIDEVNEMCRTIFSEDYASAFVGDGADKIETQANLL